MAKVKFNLPGGDEDRVAELDAIVEELSDVIGDEAEVSRDEDADADERLVVLLEGTPDAVATWVPRVAEALAGLGGPGDVRVDDARTRWRHDGEAWVGTPRRSAPVAAAPPRRAVVPAPVALPRPRYVSVGLQGWFAAVPARIPVPPGPSTGWTCPLAMFGPRVVLAKGDRGYDRALDADLLRDLLGALGRPVDPNEQEALLLATPIPAAGGAVGALSRLLRDPRYAVRQKAALMLGMLGDKSALGPLVDRLDDEDNDARRGAAEGLGRLGDLGAAPDLARRAWDSDLSVSCARLEALDRLGAWSEIAGTLDLDGHDEAPELARAIIAAVVHGDPAELAERLTAGNTDVQRVAARVFASHPPLAASCVESLVERLRDTSDEPSTLLVAAALGAAGEDALEPLVELLGDDGWEVRMFAAIALGSSPELAAGAIEALRERLDDSDDDVKREVALAMVAGGSNDPRATGLVRGNGSSRYGFFERAAALGATVDALAVPAMLMGYRAPGLELASVLVDTRLDTQVRGVGALLLALAAPELVAASLDRVARDDGRGTALEVRRFAAAGVLLAAGTPVHVPSVHRLLLCHAGDAAAKGGAGPLPELAGRAHELATIAAKDGDWPVRLDALRLLAHLGAGALAPYESLVAHIARHDPDKDVRDYASSLGARTWRVDDVGELLADALVAVHGADAEQGRRLAALRQLAADLPDVAAPLAQTLFHGDDRTLARAAAEVLGGLTRAEEVEATVTGVLGRLEDGNWVAREATCDLLGAIPRDRWPEALLDEVSELLQSRLDDDSDGDVRNAARAALGRLGRGPAVEPADEDEE